jgi:hypothetical protein
MPFPPIDRIEVCPDSYGMPPLPRVNAFAAGELGILLCAAGGRIAECCCVAGKS